MDLAPVRRVAPSEDLAAGELADGDGEGRVPDLLVDRQQGRDVELGPVEGQAGRDLGQGRGEHRDGGDPVADVDVQVLDAQGPEPPGEEAGLEQVGRRPDAPLQARPSASGGQRGRAEEPSRRTQGFQERRPGEGEHARVEDVDGRLALAHDVLADDLGGVRAADREGRDPMAQGPQLGDLAAG